MRNTLNSAFIFAVGAAIGSAVTWKIVKTRYERIAQEEIDSVKASFSDRQSEPAEGDTESETMRYLKDVAEPFAEGLAEGLMGDQLSIKDYAEKLQDMQYVDYSSNSKSSIEPKKKEEEIAPTPYVIEPEMFGEDYKCVYLTYYADGVLTYDDTEEIVEDASSIVGDNFSQHFGDYESDIVHIRNDEERCDYEISKDMRKYLDVVDDSPHQAED